MESDKLLSGAAQLIPEGYVDTIRRVTPGVTLWVLIYFLTGISDIRIESVTVGGFLLFLVVSYATGLLVDALTDWITHGFITWLAWREFNPTLEEKANIARVLSLSEEEVVCPGWGLACRHWRMPGRLRASVIETSPRAAIVLPKLVAEECLLRNIAMCMIPVAVLLYLGHSGKITLRSNWLSQGGWMAWVLIGLLALLAVVASMYRAKRTVLRTLEWFHLAHHTGAQVIKAVIFDMGGVLAFDVWEHLLLDKGEPGNPAKPLGVAALYGLRDEYVERVGRELWDTYSRPDATLSGADADLLEEHYWASFIRELRQQLPASIGVNDLRDRTDLFIKPVNQSAMESLLEELKANKIRLVICSDNTEFWFRRQMAKLRLQRFFSPSDCFVSCNVGFSKDSPGFEKFRIMSEALGIEKSSCLFVDDRRKNVEQALAYGFTPILFPSHSPKGFDYLTAVFSRLKM